MKRLKYSSIIKFITQTSIAIFGFLLLLCIYHIFHYPDYYGSNDEKFTETYYFEKTFAKYNERVAAYVMYRENGYTTTFPASDDIPSTHINETFFLNELVSDQDKFEFYNQVLNVKDSNFIYYVKNLTKGTEYYSPNLASSKYISPYKSGNDVNTNVTIQEPVDANKANYSNRTEKLQKNVADFMKNISKCDAYLVLNSNSTIYNTNVTKWGLLDSRTLEWITTSLKTKLSSSLSDETAENGSTIIDSAGDDYIFYTATINDFPYTGDDFAEGYTSFQTMHKSYKTAILYLPIIFIIFLGFLIIGVHLSGYSYRNHCLHLITYDNLNTETAGIILLTSFFILLKYLFSLINSKYSDENEYLVRLLGIYIGMYPIFIFSFFSFVRRIKCNTIRSNMLLIRTKNRISSWSERFFTHRQLTFHVAAILGIYFVLTCLAATLFKFPGFPWLGIIALFVINIIFGKQLIYVVTSLSYLINETKKISDGDLSHKINETEVTPEMRLLSRYINKISDGLSDAVNEKLKSERFKTELITNVSHDIKTPLTSIINYVDLLKKENLENTNAKQYIDVLDSKSQRLKTLIEDLVEASKASSGAITLHMQKLNLVELIKQTIGEFEDRLTQSNLEIDLQDEEQPLYIYADGRCTYRIFENILSNVNKYALKGTRVYIDLLATDEQVSISVKNISATRLNISAEELMERFVRGDTSRTTEGTGLGLSISQSLASLQNGRFEIILDGDLFKAVVTFPRVY